MLLVSALQVFLTWAVIALALTGLGSAVLALFAKDYSLPDTFWMGLAVSVAILEIWNLVLPVTTSITIFLFGVGVLGLALNRSFLWSHLLTTWQDSRALFFLGA